MESLHLEVSSQSSDYNQAKGKEINVDIEKLLPKQENLTDKNSCPEDETSEAEKTSHVVAKHYNDLQEKGLEARKDSRIYYMRNFNNWIKSVLIGDALDYIRKRRGNNYRPHVLDIGCGKGGDLRKYKIGRIGHIVCADIAETSLSQCKERYKDSQTDKFFSAEFIGADCTRARLKDMYKQESGTFDLVSIQFSFHYCFESLTQAECMIRNASEALSPGGYFIGSTTDGYEIVRRLKESGSHSFGNDVYNITFDPKYADCNEKPPLFGTKFNFHLEGVVNCPEFLVYFPIVVNICDKYGLKLVLRTRFDDFYEESTGKNSHRSLLNRMDALECFPASAGKCLMGDKDRDYEHALEFIRERLNEKRDGEKQVGTLSQSEWEAITLYIVFVFEKKGYDESNQFKRQRVDSNSHL